MENIAQIEESEIKALPEAKQIQSVFNTDFAYIAGGIAAVQSYLLILYSLTFLV